MDNVILMWATAIIAVGGALTVLWKLVTPVVRKAKVLLNALDRFTTDWFGEEAAPGRDRVPGVMERLNNIDGELKHNGGSTMKDAVKRIENTQKQIIQTQDKITARLDEGNNRFESLEQRLSDKER
jgi:hypothetical protein